MGRRRKARTLVVIVQDKSGSMHDRRAATINGFNEYKQTLLSDEIDEVLLTLVQFDTAVRSVHTARRLAEVPDLSPSTYVPGGMTALYDAVGQAIASTVRAQQSGDKVIMVIMTDGGENSSHEYRHAPLLALLEAKRSSGWDFVFLGAGEEAWSTGSSLGFTPTSSIYYTGDAHDHGVAYSALASSSNAVRRGQSMAQSLRSNTLKRDLEDKAGLPPAVPDLEDSSTVA